ncbi:MAG: glycosyltransferase family 39 protein [Candidatus Hydrogenedentes bacterium]|nr:glycosyltransferase family 39 protein [Candidatus Hydrogenedentota bacterium]
MTSTSLASLKEEFATAESLSQERAAREPGRGPAFALLVLLAAFHVAVNLWWLGADNHVIRTDEEGHMLFARTYHEVLFVNDYPDPIHRLIAASRIRPGNPAHPPLFQLLGAVMIATFGYSTDVIAGTNTVFFVLLLFGCYALARTFLRPWQALFLVFAVSFTPMVFASSRFFMTDFAAAAVVIWGLYALVKSDGYQHPGWSFFFGLLIGLGVLIRTITFAYLLLPALAAALLSLFRVLRNKPNDFGRGTLAGLTVHGLMALVVAAGVAAPWYYANLEHFYDFWANKKVGVNRGVLTNFYLTPDPPAAPSPNAPAAAPAPPDAAPLKTWYAPLLQKFQNPPVAWIRYPVYLLNNGLFVPLAALALLGALFAPLRRQFRTRTLLHLYLCILGSWVFFSVLLRFGTPRYALPVAPLAAALAALFVLGLPERTLRLGAGALMAAVLLFQFGNLTFKPYGPYARLDLPVPLPPAEARHFVDGHPVVYKDHLTLSDAYTRLGPPETENFKERLLQIMAAHEKTLPVREGQYANYQKLNLRGMELHERHFWPSDNPYRLPGMASEDAPQRRFRMIHMGVEPDHLLPRLGETDYILYQIDAALSETAAEYVRFFEARGFTLVEAFNVPAYGWVPETINGVLARKLEGELAPVDAAAIAEMDLYGLHELRYSPDFQLLPPELRALARESFESKLNAVASPFQLNDAVTFMTADVTNVGESTFRFRLVFQIHKALDRDWRMLFHGFVAPENLARLPEEKRVQGYVDWNFDPHPPATEWAPGDYAILTHQIVAEPMVYQFKFGLFQGETLYGREALLKTMDLAAIPPPAAN